eukprot:3934831-Pleurochrysis_carterae.AAC.1
MLDFLQGGAREHKRLRSFVHITHAVVGGWMLASYSLDVAVRSVDLPAVTTPASVSSIHA